MNNIVDELAAEFPELAIGILGVNEAGFESGNQNIIDEGRTLPWLQDVDLDTDGNSDNWTAWGANYRDVIIADGTNWPVAVFNVTENDLQESANYDSLKQLLYETAAGVCRSDARPCESASAETCP